MQKIKKRVPKTRYPRNLENNYAKQLSKLVKEQADILLYEYDQNIAQYLNASKSRLDGFKHDGVSDAVQAVLDKVKAITFGLFNPQKKESVASKFVQAINTTNKTQVERQAKVGGLSVSEFEPWIDDFMQAKVKENVSYITTISEDFTAKTEQIILRGVTSGESASELRKQLVAQTDATQNRAKFIARDQTGTIFGQLTKERHVKADIPGFMWSDSADSRVRPTHRERNGKYYSYSDPNVVLPGTEYGCRCVAIPEFDESKFENSAQEAEQKWAPPEPLDNLAKYDDVDKMIADQGWEEYDWDFFDAASIGRYTGHDYEKINNYLRRKGKKVANNEFAPADIDEDLEEFDDNISKALKKVKIKRNMLVYRAVKNDLFLKGIDVEKGITKFMDPAYVSTSPFMDSSFIRSNVVEHAANFKKGNTKRRPHVLIEIEVPKGTNGAYIASFSNFKHEKELLLHKNTVFRFVGDSYDENTCIRKIRLQVVKQK